MFGTNWKQMILLFCVSALAAHADAIFNPADVKATVQHLAIFSGPVANCSEPGSCQGELAPSQSCVSSYDRLYPSEKTDLDFRIFVSYWDTQPGEGADREDTVIDGQVKTVFSNILRGRCVSGLNACEFTPERESENTRELEHLTKTIIGPDGKTRVIHLTIESSSVSDSDFTNHHEDKNEQKIQSKKTMDDFFSSLNKADVVLYVGHARWGTGPGFKAVPKKLSWAWLDQGVLKPSRGRLEKTLEASQNKPKLLGYFACTSDKYYSKYLEKAAPDSGLAVTEVATSDEEAQSDALGTLNALMGLQCEDDFKKTLEYGRPDSPDAEVIDFFKP